MYPKARTQGLVTQHLPDELLVYDTDTKKAHCLNRASALVWQHCDGRTTAADMAAALREQAGVPADETYVRLALTELGRARLLDPGTFDADAAPGCTRRDLVRKAGLAVLLPVVLTVVAPTAAQAASGSRGNSGGGGVGRAGRGNRGGNGNHFGWFR